MNSKFNECLRIAARRAAVFCLALPLATLVGCGGGTGAKVSGKVTANGQPVTGGTLNFIPTEAGGVPASGAVQSDGAYTLTTQGAAGATVGKNNISYVPPASTAGSSPEGRPPPPPPYTGLQPKPAEVEVKAGTNTIDIELVPPGR